MYRQFSTTKKYKYMSRLLAKNSLKIGRNSAFSRENFKDRKKGEESGRNKLIISNVPLEREH